MQNLLFNDAVEVSFTCYLFSAFCSVEWFFFCVRLSYQKHRAEAIKVLYMHSKEPLHKTGKCRKKSPLKVGQERKKVGVTGITKEFFFGLRTEALFPQYELAYEL